MSRVLTVSLQDQPEVAIDLDRLAMIEFSQTGRQMLVRYNDGDAARYESQNAPFDIARIARKIQSNAKGFEVCDRMAIVSLDHIKFAITETPDQQGQSVLTLGVTGQRCVRMVTTAAAADHLVARMNRERPTLNCQLVQGQKIHMYPAALMLAEHREGRDTVVLDFADAGRVEVKPTSTKSGFLTAQWQGALAGIFPAQETSLCAGVVERISFQHEALQFIKHAHGVVAAARSAIKDVMPRDFVGELPMATLTVARGDAEETVSMSFESTTLRDRAVNAALSPKRGQTGSVLKL